MPAQTHSKFHTKAFSLTTTNDTTIYTVPNNYSGVIRLLLASNTTNSNADITIKWYHADDDETHTIIGEERISANSHEKLLSGDSPFFVHAGDILKATAGTANAFEITVSVEEYYDPNRG